MVFRRSSVVVKKNIFILFIHFDFQNYVYFAPISVLVIPVKRCVIPLGNIDKMDVIYKKTPEIT